MKNERFASPCKRLPALTAQANRALDPHAAPVRHVQRHDHEVGVPRRNRIAHVAQLRGLDRQFTDNNRGDVRPLFQRLTGLLHFPDVEHRAVPHGDVPQQQRQPRGFRAEDPWGGEETGPPKYCMKNDGQGVTRDIAGAFPGCWFQRGRNDREGVSLLRQPAGDCAYPVVDLPGIVAPRAGKRDERIDLHARRSRQPFGNDHCPLSRPDLIAARCHTVTSCIEKTEGIEEIADKAEVVSAAMAADNVTQPVAGKAGAAGLIRYCP